MTKQEKFYPEGQRLGEMGLENFAPYLMNRIIGRYNAALSSEMTKIGLPVLTLMEETILFIQKIGNSTLVRLITDSQ